MIQHLAMRQMCGVKFRNCKPPPWNPCGIRTGDCSFKDCVAKQVCYLKGRRGYYLLVMVEVLRYIAYIGLYVG